MNETLTVFMISEIERLREEGREPARRIYHNMLRTLRDPHGGAYDPHVGVSG